MNTIIDIQGTIRAELLSRKKHMPTICNVCSIVLKTGTGDRTGGPNEPGF